MEKLVSWGIEPNILECKLFTQCVVVEGEESTVVPVLSEVPQGSVLGPLLFSAFINDVVECVNLVGSRNILYADDLLLYKSVNSTQELVNPQQDIDAIVEWSARNYLNLNSNKCKVMVISRK